MPPSPDFASSPLPWGTEDHVRRLFDGLGMDLEPLSRWDALLAELRPALVRMLTEPAEYLVRIGTKPALKTTPCRWCN